MLKELEDIMAGNEDNEHGDGSGIEGKSETVKDDCNETEESTNDATDTKQENGTDA